MSAPTGVLFEDEQLDDVSGIQEKSNGVETKENTYKVRLVWRNIILLTLEHIGAVYGAYFIFTSAKIATTIFAFILEEITKIGITAGPHRLWAHRSYKAKLPLRIILVILQTIAFQMSVILWARDHRQHHKYSDTNADLHSAKRGFFYSHIGWLLSRRHPDVLEKGKGMDLSDLHADPILAFQHKYFIWIAPLACYALPPTIAVYAWNETWLNAFTITALLRWIVSLHCTFLVNSVAHAYGNKPYDRNMKPVQNKTVALLAMGEGWHNYHHAFPWDYKTAELGNYSLNVTTAFIDFMAWIGWACDLKTVSSDIIEKRVRRTGDGTHEVWGWNDKDVKKEDREATIITHKRM